MKTRLPKMLLAALLAAMSVSTVQAGTYTPAQLGTQTTMANPGAIITGSENIGEWNKYHGDVAGTNAHGGYSRPIVKDGVDTELTVTDVTQMYAPLYIREGSALINSSTNNQVHMKFINGESSSITSHAQAVIQVSGQNASLTIDNVKIENTGNVNPTYLAVGAPDGSGKLILQNGADLHINSFFGGYSSGSYTSSNQNPTQTLQGYFRCNSTAAEINGADRYTSGDYVVVTDCGDATAEKPIYLAQADITIDSTSKLRTDTASYLGQANITVDGGLFQTGKNPNYGMQLGREDGSTTHITVKNGGTLDTQAIMTGDYARNADFKSVTIDVTGEGSKLTYTGSDETHTGAIKLGFSESGTSALNVSDKGYVNAHTIILGRDDATDADAGKSSMTITSDATVEVTNLEMKGGSKLTNDATLTADKVDVTGGVVTGKGKADIGTMNLSAGSYENRNSGTTIDTLNVSGGTFTNRGTLNKATQDTSVINISGGTFTGRSYVYANEINVTGGELYGKSDIYAGTVNVNDGKFKSEASTRITSLNVTGGVVTLQSLNALNKEEGGQLSVNVSGGSLLTINANVNIDELTMSGGEYLANSITVGELIMKSGTLTMGYTGGTLTVNNSLTFYIDEFDSAANTASSSASINLTDGSLTLANDANVGLMLSDAVTSQLFNELGSMDNSTTIDLSGLLTGQNANATQIEALQEKLADNVGIVGGANGKYIEMTNVEMVGGQLTATVKYVPEPATATLSLLALAGLAARRRRKN